MDLNVEKVEVWAASIEDKPGDLSRVLTGLREAGADLNFIIARRAKEGTGALFVTPLRGEKEVAAAANLGFKVTSSVQSVRVEGEDKPGIAAELTQMIAAKGINLRGFSGSAVGSRFIIYIGLDSRDDAEKVVEILSRA